MVDWHPDGKRLMFASARENGVGRLNQFFLVDKEGGFPEKLQVPYGELASFSPDGNKLAYITKITENYPFKRYFGGLASDVILFDLKKNEAGNYRWNLGHGSRFGFPISWSPDSKWLAFTQGLDNSNAAVFIFNTEDKQLQQVTSGFYDDNFPVFSADGKYLFYLTNRNMDAAYSSLGDGTWIYPNSTRIAALALKADTPSLLEPKNDEVEIKEEAKAEEKTEAEEKEKSDEKKEDDKKESKDDKKEDSVKVEIDFENLETRLSILPPKPGNISALIPFEGKLVYLRRPNTGSGERSSSLHFFDLKEREEKKIMGDVNRAEATADGKSLIVSSQNKYGIIQPAPGQKIEKPIPTDGLVMNLIPKEEWKQIFTDTWRRHRDFFYDPNMHGLDWEALRDRYGKLLDRFLELLQRPVTYNLHWRHGKYHTNPVKTNTGPVGMLINGWAGSGGDGLPWAFKVLEAGPIVGERTPGILVGPATGHQLIDGGGITVPGARLYDNAGHWFWEGEGVSPDFEVWDDPNILLKGRDPQMEKVVEEVLKLTKENKHLMTPAPPLEDRTAKGLRKKM